MPEKMYKTGEQDLHGPCRVRNGRGRTVNAIQSPNRALVVLPLALASDRMRHRHTNREMNRIEE